MMWYILELIKMAWAPQHSIYLMTLTTTLSEKNQKYTFFDIFQGSGEVIHYSEFQSQTFIVILLIYLSFYPQSFIKIGEVIMILLNIMFNVWVARMGRST
jgi:hypothetical protein